MPKFTLEFDSIDEARLLAGHVAYAEAEIGRAPGVARSDWMLERVREISRARVARASDAELKSFADKMAAFCTAIAADAKRREEAENV